MKFAQLWPGKNNTVPVDDDIMSAFRHCEILLGRPANRGSSNDSNQNYSAGTDSLFVRCLLGAGRVALARCAAFLRSK